MTGRAQLGLRRVVDTQVVVIGMVVRIVTGRALHRVASAEEPDAGTLGRSHRIQSCVLRGIEIHIHGVIVG